MTSKVMVSFPDEFLQEVDRLAAEEHRSRSELMREAIRAYIEKRRRERKPGEMLTVRRAVAAQDAVSRVASGAGEDSTSDVRHLRDGQRI